jgi:hypothetical protein
LQEDRICCKESDADQRFCKNLMSLKNKLLSWHNKPEIVGRICSQAATLVVKESVEPLLEDYRPPGITSLKFNKFSLGTVPPKIEGMNQQMLISVM